ncbi:TIGR04104 family putative zinc finger protein [Thalassobacillus sp. CUG 92003]|uniref:TIGR04104 family putative zinc finger protein n=1 Tax=Thalassobacillus sp. CUG 92003 TaxID=2736641 RepID=UPI0015E6ADD1
MGVITIQKCNYCSSQFNWSVILISLMLGYKPIKCDKCGKEHKIAFSSRVFPSIFLVVPICMLSYFINVESSITVNYALIVMIVYGVIFILLLPFFVKYKLVK